MERIIVFDTTLRDGEQSPGASMNMQEKVRIARQLERLGVDVIEAGFPAASKGDLEAVRMVASSVERPEVAALARANKDDIDKAFEAVKVARKPRIHTFIATSEIHMVHKLRMDQEQVLRAAVDAVAYAKGKVQSVEFSAEDASRSDPDFLCKVFEAVIEAGATTGGV
jgi:2-isopropylmalate synthase